MKGAVLIVLIGATVTAYASDSFEESTTKIARGVYDQCSNSEDFYVCLKKKAITFLDRLGRSDKISISDSVKVVRAVNAPLPKEEVTEAKLEEILPRSADAKNAALSEMLSSKVSDFLGSRTIEISLPRALSDDDGDDDDIEEARFGGKKKKKGGKKKGGCGAILLLLGAKLLMIKSLLIASLFFLAKKALIIAKIALILSAIVAFKKLLLAKSAGSSVTHVLAEAVHGGGIGGGHGVGHGGGHGFVGGHGGYGGGHDEGWAGGYGGGGWEKRAGSSAQELAYNAYSP